MCDRVLMLVRGWLASDLSLADLRRGEMFQPPPRARQRNVLLFALFPMLKRCAVLRRR